MMCMSWLDPGVAAYFFLAPPAPCLKYLTCGNVTRTRITSTLHWVRDMLHCSHALSCDLSRPSRPLPPHTHPPTHTRAHPPTRTHTFMSFALHDISILYFIQFPLCLIFPRSFTCCLAAMLFEVIVCHGLGDDEILFEIAVDHTGGTRSETTTLHRTSTWRQHGAHTHSNILAQEMKPWSVSSILAHGLYAWPAHGVRRVSLTRMVHARTSCGPHVK